MGIMSARSKRMLIFVGTRAALEAYDMAGVPIITYQFGREHIEKMIYDFSMSDDAMLVVGGGFTDGWRVPPDTFIVFDSSWPFAHNHPRTIQARGRAQRLPSSLT